NLSVLIRPNNAGTRCLFPSLLSPPYPALFLPFSPIITHPTSPFSPSAVSLPNTTEFKEQKRKRKVSDRHAGTLAVHLDKFAVSFGKTDIRQIQKDPYRF
ncbi:MAG: hypothetical protein LBK99_05140, partial [Opitutaceae bacterium]|nr:hypothetical protein [Opitutaceae bacterium]